MKVKEESEKLGLKLNIQKTKIMASGPITSWKVEGETMETVSDFIFGGSKIPEGACSHKIKRLTPWCWERLKMRGEGDNRGWNGWVASPSWCTWDWVNSGSWWWTVRPVVVQSMGSQWGWHHWATELKWNQDENQEALRRHLYVLMVVSVLIHLFSGTQFW